MRPTKDLLAGLLFSAVGLGVVVTASSYPFGTAHHMGPAYFPTMLGGLIMTMGAFLAGRAALRPETSEPVSGIALQPVLAIFAAILTFAFAIQAAGLAITVSAVVVLCRLARRGARPLEVAVTSAVLVVLCYGLFVYGFGMPFNLGFG